MLTTAKVFANGHSQAIRLPKAFRVDVQEMWIARNEVTGEITLKPKDTQALRHQRLDALMATIAENPLPDSFLSDESRQNDPPTNPFADWTSSAPTPHSPQHSPPQSPPHSPPGAALETKRPSKRAAVRRADTKEAT
jgi:antitoxin VapB